MAKLLPVQNAPLPGIENIVVVMFENRSFDNVLGMLSGPPGFDGVPADASNIYKPDFGKPVTVTVTVTPPSGNSGWITPYPDPGESFDDMSQQLDNGAMSGFAQNYHHVAALKGADIGDIMFCFAPGELPVTHILGDMFAMSDQWFASGPVQTFPNRMFCHCATPSVDGNGNARLNDIDYLVDKWHPDSIKGVAGAVTDTSIFQLLDQAAGDETPSAANWKVYFHDTPMSAINQYVNDAWQANSPCVANYDNSDYQPPAGTSFAQDILNDALPTYSFIEPRYFSKYSNSGLPPNSNHPGESGPWGHDHEPIDTRNGEDLLANIFVCLLANPTVFNKTLLIVVYDEHGGLYDHVSPPTEPVVPSPFTNPPGNYAYAAYGVRVPAIFINPRIPPSLCRPPQGGLPFDHCSIISTLRAQFGLGSPLTPRDAAAPILSELVLAGIPISPIASPLFAAAEKIRAWQSARPIRPGTPQPPLSPAEHDRRLTEYVLAKKKMD